MVHNMFLGTSLPSSPTHLLHAPDSSTPPTDGFLQILEKQTYFHLAAFVFAFHSSLSVLSLDIHMDHPSLP